MPYPDASYNAPIYREQGGAAMVIGPTRINTAAGERLAKVAKLALAAVDTGGGVLSWLNPEGVPILITRLVIDVTTQSSGACTISFGTTPTSGTTSSNNLLTALSVAATGTFDNLNDAGASGKSRQKLATGAWVTGSVASGASAGLVGSAYLEYVIA